MDKKEFAELLGASLKAIHSYEQGLFIFLVHKVVFYGYYADVVSLKHRRSVGRREKQNGEQDRKSRKI